MAMMGVLHQRGRTKVVARPHGEGSIRYLLDNSVLGGECFHSELKRRL